ncbi:TetR-like C-terminal domain-containing protein [Saccharopolyspora pogona]|uniref:TetR-like C-terminal domain-containing protein n=1 Tax=Saccharopolyspora pogona TaxID=333966 RepID=UPI00168773DE|nr:TetR-like C-terminal domain-containing protein [Saccharopolyspora pogona]
MPPPHDLHIGCKTTLSSPLLKIHREFYGTSDQLVRSADRRNLLANRVITAETIRDLLFGPLVYHWLITGEPLDRATAETLIAAARRAVSP